MFTWSQNQLVKEQNPLKKKLTFVLWATFLSSSSVMSMWGEIVEERRKTKGEKRAKEKQEESHDEAKEEEEEAVQPVGQAHQRDVEEEEEEDSEEEDLDEERSALLSALAKCPVAHFKSQQRGEPELTERQRRRLAAEVLERSPALFLARFGAHLAEAHLEYFDSMAEWDTEVAFHLKRLREEGCKFSRRKRARNRR